MGLQRNGECQGRGRPRTGTRKPLKRQSLETPTAPGEQASAGTSVYGKPDSACGKAAGPKNKTRESIPGRYNLHPFGLKSTDRRQSQPVLRHPPSQTNKEEDNQQTLHPLALPSNHRPARKKKPTNPPHPTRVPPPHQPHQTNKRKEPAAPPPHPQTKNSESALKGPQSSPKISSKKVKPFVCCICTGYRKTGSPRPGEASQRPRTPSGETVCSFFQNVNAPCNRR